MSTENVYIYEREHWDYETCLKKSKSRMNMGYDAPKGYIGKHFGKATFNGKVKIDDNMYDATYIPLPIIDEHFEIVYVNSWGYFIKEWNNHDAIFSR
jgi:hypothetical protein